MKNNNNKRNIIIASVVGVIILLIAIAGVVHSTSKEKVETANVESSQEVNLDSTISEVAETSIGQSVAEEKTEKSTEATSEASVEASVEASTEASTEEKVEATTETSETTETVTVEAVANASTNTETVQTSTQSNGTVGWPNAEGGYIPNNTHGWPVISGYVGTGEGPGAAWRADFNYRDNTDAANHADANDPNSNQWDWVTIVTASNGVKVKCFEMTNGYLIINDGAGKDLEPNSKWMAALREIQAGGDTETINYWNSSSGATLPTTSFKRTSIDTGDASIVAFKQAFEAYAKQITADAQLVTNANGFQFIDANYNTFWSITYDGDKWNVRLNTNPATRSWEAMKEIMHYVTPDGNAIYDAIYDDWYVGSYENPIEDFDNWYSIGGSQVYCVNTNGAGYGLYYIK